MSNTTARAEQLDMLAQIDAATATASHAAMPKRARGMTGESLKNARAAHVAAAGFVTLRTPRGSFRVRNTRERLAEVARKMRAPGAFGPGRKLPIGRESEGTHTPARMMARLPRAAQMTGDAIAAEIAQMKCEAQDLMRRMWATSYTVPGHRKSELVFYAERIDALQRELVARGLLDATDLDKVTAEPLDESDSEPVQATSAPWAMTAAEWDSATDRARACNAQSNFTRNSGAEAVAMAKESERLRFGVRSCDTARLNAAIRGEVKLSPQELEALTDRLQTRVTHRDVIAKAVKEGMPVPAEVLAEYPDLDPAALIDSTLPVQAIESTPPVPALQVGRRARYRGWGPGRMDSGPGIVVAVRGGVHGPMLEVVTLQDGKRRTFRELDTLGPDPVLVLENAMASDVETSRAARLAAETQAGADAEKSLAAVRREVEVERLRAAHPHLLPASDRRAVGHNLRALLKAAGIRASVRKADASCYRVTLPSGSTDAQLAQASEICGRFRAGHFDGMTDSYEYTRSAWTDAFGGVRFVFTQRDWRDADQDAPSPPTAAPPPATLDDSTLPVLAIDSTPPVPAIDSTPPVPASVTHLAAWRAKQARQREICGTTPARAAQNPRTRLRFDHASGEWMAVYRWHG